ncbi:hypothetical protein HIM_05258 [Hirsutella minnesotensis 3608]|uniref:Uncharacterized protein n=1 Tax=Hirsutella minnesotensis 3608 TaxID=1043627 RepID=A0A0F8A0H3_9HYPO|nr:hypothetical protein HIM_05258 [Hirsutella minnesotensis 3608]
MSSGVPGEKFEPRQTTDTSDCTPDPSKSLKLPPPRQALIDDILALYSCQPTIKRVERYTPDCVYDDLFGYANDRHKVAAQWFALPKMFKSSENMGYEITKNEDQLIQFKSEQKWTFRLVPISKTIKSLISLSLEPESAGSDSPRIIYHKDQANDKDYSHEGLGFRLKKWQADNLPNYMNQEEVKYFEKDKGAAKAAPNKD